MLQNKTVIITGASRGIGLACAKKFLQEGATVVLSDIDDEAGRSATASLGEKALYRHCDVRHKADIEDLMAFSREQYGRVDTVIANAGIVRSGDLLEMEEKDFDEVIRINLRGVFLTGQAAARLMIQQEPDEEDSRGTIINMSSVNAILTIPGIAPYVIAKGGVNQWTKVLAIRLATEKIRVNAIGPGSINTEMFHSIANNPEKYAEVMSRTPMQRPGEPDEVAKVAVFLASSYSSYVTGQTVYPDGGRLGLNYVVPVQK